jgi:hypothetical protein
MPATKGTSSKRVVELRSVTATSILGSSQCVGRVAVFIEAEPPVRGLSHEYNQMVDTPMSIIIEIPTL